MTDGTTHEFAAFIGLDWADAQHDVCLQVAGSDKREFQVLAYRPSGRGSSTGVQMDSHRVSVLANQSAL
jgi:hypothetical protein